MSVPDVYEVEFDAEGEWDWSDFSPAGEIDVRSKPWGGSNRSSRHVREVLG